MLVTMNNKSALMNLFLLKGNDELLKRNEKILNHNKKKKK